ncbi:MAG TPA: L-ribulose-5-phosphate 4-epimerase [Clostridium sp.]|jgi:L-ribulose-5-phosphate 4-epimerase|nr:L-ribulose-5-phosphate 4-epimerase [Clostridium sp.]
MLEKLKNEVLEANLLLPKYNLVKFTWGNVSGIDREKGLMVIKPSGVEYDKMKAEDMVVVDLNSGEKVEGNLNPSSDTPTHIALYKAFDQIGGITHTHSPWATMFAQGGMGIPPLGTTHADYFYGEIPCTKKMPKEMIDEFYEAQTGNLIIQTLKERNICASQVPSCLVYSHGPFSWGTSPSNSVHNAVVLEEIAFMAWHNIVIDPKIQPIQKELLDKHYLRKHGKNAYYGQR